MNLQPITKVSPVVFTSDSPVNEAKQVNMTNEEYHSDRAAVSSTSLKEILRSPMHYHYLINNGRVEKPAYRVGTAIHTYLLEHDRFIKEYVVAPDRGQSKASKANYDAFVNSHPGCHFISSDEMEILKGIGEMVRRHKVASQLLECGSSEQTFFWRDKETGILCKIRTDHLYIPYCILDVKSCRDASAEGFKKDIENLKYDFSASMYQEGIFQATGKKLDFAWLAVEKTAPYGVALYKASEADLEKGYRKFRKALNILKSCRETGYYPSYQPDDQIEIINTASWYK